MIILVCRINDPCGQCQIGNSCGLVATYACHLWMESGDAWFDRNDDADFAKAVTSREVILDAVQHQHLWTTDGRYDSDCTRFIRGTEVQNLHALFASKSKTKYTLPDTYAGDMSLDGCLGLVARHLFDFESRRGGMEMAVAVNNAVSRRSGSHWIAVYVSIEEQQVSIAD